MSSVELSSRSSCYVFSQEFAYFFLVKRVKCSVIFLLYSVPKQLNLVPRSSRLIVQKNWQFSRTIDVIFHTSQNFSKFGRQQLVVMNYVWDFSQSEAKKYYECNDCNNTLPTINMLSGFHDGSD